MTDSGHSSSGWSYLLHRDPQVGRLDRLMKALVARRLTERAKEKMQLGAEKKRGKAIGHPVRIIAHGLLSAMLTTEAC